MPLSRSPLFGPSSNSKPPNTITQSTEPRRIANASARVEISAPAYRQAHINVCKRVCESKALEWGLSMHTSANIHKHTPYTYSLYCRIYFLRYVCVNTPTRAWNHAICIRTFRSCAVWVRCVDAKIVTHHSFTTQMCARVCEA